MTHDEYNNAIAAISVKRLVRNAELNYEIAKVSVDILIHRIMHAIYSK